MSLFVVSVIALEESVAVVDPTPIVVEEPIEVESEVPIAFLLELQAAIDNDNNKAAKLNLNNFFMVGWLMFDKQQGQ